MRQEAKLGLSRYPDAGFLQRQPARSETMVIFKCPYYGTEYEMTTAQLSFQQRNYAKCQICNQISTAGMPETCRSSSL
jgi:hypothetical protein